MQRLHLERTNVKMLEAQSLKKAVVPSTLIQDPSPGSLQSTRLSLHVSKDPRFCFIYIASGCDIFKLQITLEESSVCKGKEGLLIPEQTEVIDSSLLNLCPHRSEIQSIVLAKAGSHGYLTLGSVDSYGHLIVSKLDTSGKDVDRLAYSVSPNDYGIGEGCWSGLSFSPSQCFMAAVARSFCKAIDIYDQDIHIRTLRTLWCPTSLNFMQNVVGGDGGSIIAVTEGCQLTVWDLRTNENGGCIHRICGSPGDIYYSVCSSSTGNVAVGGADRTLTIYDPRRLQVLLSQQLTLTISMYKGLIMRSFVDNGKKATNYFPLEEIQTGLDLPSAPTWMFWVDGVIQEAYSSLMLVVGEKEKLASDQLCHH